MKKYMVVADNLNTRYFDDYQLALRFAMRWVESGNANSTTVARSDGTLLASYVKHYEEEQTCN